MKVKILFLECLLVFSATAFTACQSRQNEGLIQQTNQELSYTIDQLVAELYNQYGIQSGLTIGVIQEGVVSYAKGFGYAYPEKNIKMSPETPVYLASHSKSILAAVARKLISEGTLDLDKSIKDYLPNFSFSNKDLDASTINIKELITHTHGLRNNTLQYITAFVGSSGPESEYFLLKEATTSRDNKQFRYSNLGTLILGQVIDKVTGKRWQDHIRHYLFDPLELKNTSSFVSYFEEDQLARNIVNANNNKIYSEQNQFDNTMHAAGGQYSSTLDLLTWISVFMNEGKYKGKEIFTKEELEDILKPHASQDRQFHNYHRTHYSLGWDISDFNGERMWSRFGSNKGLYMHVSFMPEHNIGVVVHSNGEGFAPMVDLTASYIYNTLLEKDNTQSILEKNKKELAQRLERFSNRGSLRFFEKPPRYEEDINGFRGVYKHELWGTTRIEVEDGLLKMDWGHVKGVLHLSEEDKNLYLSNSYPSCRIRFVKENGKVTTLNNGGDLFKRID